jgi:aminocarboxymuconate-semialdehyde decarboxylase
LKIDTHNHVIPEEVIELLDRDAVFGAHVEGKTFKGRTHVDFDFGDSYRSPAAHIAELESKGLDGAVISAAPPLFYYDTPIEACAAMCEAANAGMKRFCEHSPDRFRWMAHIPMPAPDRAAAMLEQAAANGAVGVEVGTSIAGKRLDEPEFDVFWAATERLALPVLIHPAYNEASRPLNDFYFQNVIGNMLETTIAIERIICSGLLDRHPKVRIELVHSGGYFPYQAGRLRHARTVRPELAESPADPWAYIGQIIIDTITHDRGALEYLVRRVGADNVVMGTDLPFDMATPRPMDDLLAAVDAATAKKIAEANPARIYGLGE